jgi:GNAT superfamily N-acetyltransferase
MTHTGSVTIAVWRVSGSDPRFDEVAGLFDGYRQHYGANPAPAAAGRWLRTQHDADRLQLFAAASGDGAGGDGAGRGRVWGLLTVTVVPASLTLRTAWLVRDLYVDPIARRRGVARALLTHVTAAAVRAGAHRLSLQTEIDNTRALALYAAAGFEPVTDLALLNLRLEPPRPGAGARGTAADYRAT